MNEDKIVELIWAMTFVKYFDAKVQPADRKGSAQKAINLANESVCEFSRYLRLHNIGEEYIR